MDNLNIVSDIRPWPGLAPYSVSESKYFLGRTKEITELANCVVSEPLICVYGSSGVGKTSLLQAGVGNKIQEFRFFPVFIRLSHQNDANYYVSQVIDAVKAVAESSKLKIKEIAPSILKNKTESLWEFFHRHIFESTQKDCLVKPLIIFDQFEEIFTLNENQTKTKDFITELGDLADNYIPKRVQEFLREPNSRFSIPSNTHDYRIIIALRDDFLAQFETVTNNIPVFKHNRFAINPLNGKQALEVINVPGKNIVEENVAEEIINAISPANKNSSETIPINERKVEPSLISLFCRELNEKRISEGKEKITLDLVEKNKSNIIQNFYFNSVNSVSVQTREYIEEKLLNISGCRKPVALEDFIDAKISAKEVDKLINLRLLRKEARQDIPWVEFSHDILANEAMKSRDSRRAEQALIKEKEYADELKKRIKN